MKVYSSNAKRLILTIGKNVIVDMKGRKRRKI
jgi:hypothetical protein